MLDLYTDHHASVAAAENYQYPSVQTPRIIVLEMAMPELDIATTSPEHSIEGKFHDEPKWASEVQPIRAQISEDGMSDETLRDMDFPLNTTPMSRCRDALTTFAI